MPGKSHNNLLQAAIAIVVMVLVGCTGHPERKPAETKDYIRAIPGKSDSIPEINRQKGQVLIAYSDCGTCHKEDSKSVGPAFRDIARRYPANEGYIELLAQKIIVGGSGAWGYPVMTPHPEIKPEDARLMVQYILSLDDDRR